MQTKSITAYNLYDYSVALQQAVTEGYRLNTKNEYFPVQLGSNLFTCTLVKEDAETDDEPDVQVEQPKVRARKTKE